MRRRSVNIEEVAATATTSTTCRRACTAPTWGRQLDATPASLDRLAPIAEAVGGRLPLLLDGGLRRGTDVAKAMALGALAVAIGRPVLWGLAVAGEAGVRRVLELLRVELTNALTLLGVGAPTELTREQVVP